MASAALYTIGVACKALTKPEPVTAIGIVAPAVAAAASMMMPVLVCVTTLKVPAPCTLPAATAPWMSDNVCATAARMVPAVVHVRVEPAAAEPAAKAQLNVAVAVVIVFALLVSAKLK